MHAYNKRNIRELFLNFVSTIVGYNLGSKFAVVVELIKLFRVCYKLLHEYCDDFCLGRKSALIMVCSYLTSPCILRISAHALRYMVCREVSHILLQQNKTKHRKHLHAFFACNQDFYQHKTTSYDSDCDMPPSSTLCTRVSPLYLALYIGHRVGSDCWDICQ